MVNNQIPIEDIADLHPCELDLDFLELDEDEDEPFIASAAEQRSSGVGPLARLDCVLRAG